MRRFVPHALLLALLVVALMVVPLFSGAATTDTTTCEKVKGTWVCTTFSGPGMNQGGVGTTTDTTTQGNTTNLSPTPQGTGSVSSCSPNGNSANCK
jgi:hypothetical protein